MTLTLEIPHWFISLGYVEAGLLLAAIGGVVWCWLGKCGRRARSAEEQRAAMMRLDWICMIDNFDTIKKR